MPSESAHAHPHRQVLALHKRGGDIGRVWVASDALLKLARADGRAVAPLSGCVLAAVAFVHLDQHGVVDVRSEGAFDGLQVNLVAVRGQLHATREPVSEIADECLGCEAVAASDGPRRHELGIGV